MEDFDYNQIEEILHENPSTFSFPRPEMRWQPPSRLLFIIPLRFLEGNVWSDDAFVIPVDMFAEKEISEQLWDRLRAPLCSTQSPFRHEWSDKLCSQHEELKLKIAEIPMLFKPPLKYVHRSEFDEVGLATILGNRPELFDIYVAEGTGRHLCRYWLRIHSSLKVPQTGYLWFEKRIPEGVGPEETWSWFEALIRKLPKQCRPPNIESWLGKLAEYDKHMVKQEPKQANNWMDRSKIVIVCGQESNPSGAHKYHVYREEFRRFRREGNLLEFSSEKEQLLPSGRRIECSRFIIICHDAVAAETVERALHDGTKVYFGLGETITGIIHLSDDSVDAVGVDEEVIRAHCCPNGEELDSTPTRRKRKFYWIRREGGVGETHLGT